MASSAISPNLIRDLADRQTTDSSRKISRHVLAAAVIAATLLLFAWRWTPQGYDDTWITYRYARNIAAGHGWAYNAGERIQGGSTPLYTLWLAVCAACGASIPVVSAVTGCVATCVIALMIFQIMAERLSASAGLCAVALLLASPFMRTATSGMETPVYACLCLGAVLSAGMGRWHIAFALAGLAMFTRLDGAATLAAISCWYLFERRRFPIRELIFPVALNLAWFLFAYLYFGKALPNSYYAKRFHSGHAHVSWWMIGALLDLAPAWWIMAMVGVGVAVKRRYRWLAPTMIWAVGYVAAYSLSRLDFYSWYVAPMLIVICMLAAIGVWGIVNRMPQGKPRVLIGAILAIVVLGPGLWDGARMDRRYAIPDVERARYEGAMYAARVVPRGAVIEAAGIGQIGWCTDNYILDAAGLVSPQTLADRPSPWFWHALDDVARQQRPDYIFDAIETATGWPPGVTQNYHSVATFPLDSATLTPFVLWERN